MGRTRIRKRLRVRRRSQPPAGEPPKTWVQIVFFPVSIMTFTVMVLMLLLYIWSIHMETPPNNHHEVYVQPAPIPLEVPSPDHTLAIDPPPLPAEDPPAGGIVIER